MIGLTRNGAIRINNLIARHVMGYCVHEDVRKMKLGGKMCCPDCGFETDNPAKLNSFRPSKNPGHVTHALWKWQKITAGSKSLYQIEYDGETFHIILSWNDGASLITSDHCSLPIAGSKALEEWIMDNVIKFDDSGREAIPWWQTGGTR